MVLFGHGKSFLAALITGVVDPEQADAEITQLNTTLPHYRQVRAWHIEPQPLTIESGLLTANGKLKREAIAARFRDAIENMYESATAKKAG